MLIDYEYFVESLQAHFDKLLGGPVPSITETLWSQKFMHFLWDTLIQGAIYFL